MSVQHRSAYAAVVAIGVGLVACGGGNREPSPPPAQTSTPIPAYKETNNINMIIDEIVMGTESTLVSGWAFIVHRDAVGGQTSVLLRKGPTMGEFPVEKVVRGDVAAAYKHPGVTDSGFRVEIRNGSLPAGEYELGIRIRRGAEEAVQFTPRTVTLR